MRKYCTVDRMVARSPRSSLSCVQRNPNLTLESITEYSKLQHVRLHLLVPWYLWCGNPNRWYGTVISKLWFPVVVAIDHTFLSPTCSELQHWQPRVTFSAQHSPLKHASYPPQIGPRSSAGSKSTRVLFNNHTAAHACKFQMTSS